MRLKYFLAFLCRVLTNPIFAVVISSSNDTIDFAVQFFSFKRIKMVTSILCWKTDTDKRELLKQFSENGMAVNSLEDFSKWDDSEMVNILSSEYQRSGVILDMNCANSSGILNLASENHLFTFSFTSTAWLLLFDERVSREDVMEEARTYIPKFTNFTEYILAPYNNTNNSELLTSINKQMNAQYLSEDHPQKVVNSTPKRNNSSMLFHLYKLNIFIDNEITLAIPGSKNRELFVIFEVYKPTFHSDVIVEETGIAEKVNSEVRFKSYEGGYAPTVLKRRDMRGDSVRCVSAVQYPLKFTTMDDLRLRDVDVWAKINYAVSTSLAENLNFRIVSRMFDDYGWRINGTYKWSGMIGYVQQGQADFIAVGLMFHPDRYLIIDYLDSPFRLLTGMLLRQPSLSSVTNVFLLPFSSTVWFCILGMAVIMGIALWCHTNRGRELEDEPRPMCSSDIVLFIIGAICQQGNLEIPSSISARITILFLLITCLALSTSFSATIVALLQSPSASIKTIDDITMGSIEVGLETNFPLHRIFLREANNTQIKNFYLRKVAGRGEKAYWDARTGIERFRKHLFAFQVELPIGYKIISETFKEREKCGIIELQLFPKLTLGSSVRKYSPYREMFVERLRWFNEVGYVYRIWKRWVPQKPKCEDRRVGFISVGLTEFNPALLVFAWGVVASTMILALEYFYHRRNALLCSIRLKNQKRINELNKFSKKLKIQNSKLPDYLE